jgi:hypothetical protein
VNATASDVVRRDLSGHIHPQVAEISLGSSGHAITTDEPQVSVRVNPATHERASAGNIAGSGRTEGAIYTVLVNQVGSGRPRPLTVAVLP